MMMYTSTEILIPITAMNISDLSMIRPRKNAEINPTQIAIDAVIASVGIVTAMLGGMASRIISDTGSF